MHSDTLGLRFKMKQNVSSGKGTITLQEDTDQNSRFQHEESQKLKLKFNIWPVVYDHNYRTLWNTTYRIFEYIYIYQRNVVQKRFLKPSEFSKNFFLAMLLPE